MRGRGSHSQEPLLAALVDVLTAIWRKQRAGRASASSPASVAINVHRQEILGLKGLQGLHH